MVELRIKGERALLRQFERLGAVGEAKALGEAVTDAAEPIIRDAQSRAPSPVIAEGIQIVNVIANERGKVTAEVGLPGGRKPWFHGLFVELGTGPRVQKRTGRRTGAMPARPFLRPAFRAQRDAAQAAFGRSIRNRLMEIARRG